MKLFNHLVRWVSSQRQLYFLLVLLFIVPNFVLLFTESMPFWVGVASILLPLAFWSGLLLVVRKPGIVAWCLLPKVILDGGQLVLLCVFGQSVVAVDMFLNVTSSDASEASELLGNLLLIISCVFFLYTLPTLWLAFRSVRSKEKLTTSFRKRYACVSLGLLLAGCGAGIASLGHEQPFSLKNDAYPANALYNLYFAINKAERNANYAQTSAHFTFQAHKPVQAEGKREIYVLVVGETSRAMEWSLYGYERETTPHMEQLDGLLHFTDAITQSNNTHKSVPIILSSSSAENYGVIYKEKSIVTAFKEAGFHTLVIANQKLTTSMIGAFYREADTFIDMSKFNTGSYLTSLHDGELLPYLQQELNNTTGNLFVVLHTYGSHFKYNERYPQEFSFYKPDRVDGIRASHRPILQNAYDNSIRYTDYLLNSIVSQLSTTNACVSMMYLSDHGEDIFDDSRNRYLHASPIPTYYQLHIPLLVWFSPQYRAAYPEKCQIVRSHTDWPVSTNMVFHTMLDLAGIETPVADPSLSVSSNSFVVRDRMYLGDHDNPVPFWKIGLKRPDFEMMDKWGIVYTRE